MAITVAEFETVLGEIRTAITGDDWTTAWKKYAEAEVILAGIPTNSAFDGASVAMRQRLDGIKQGLEAATAKGSLSGEQRRLITTRVTH